MSTVAERWMMQGYQEGYEIGFKIGGLRNTRKNIITLLRIHFKRVPKTIQRQINDRCDMIALESLFQLALTAQSLKEFAEEL